MVVLEMDVLQEERRFLKLFLTQVKGLRTEDVTLVQSLYNLLNIACDFGL